MKGNQRNGKVNNLISHTSLWIKLSLILGILLVFPLAACAEMPDVKTIIPDKENTEEVEKAAKVKKVEEVQLAKSSTKQTPTGHPAVKQGQDCTTSKCHSEFGTAKWVHSPVATDSCQVCHNTETAKSKFGSLIFEGSALCLDCHEDKKSFYKEKFIHSPVESEECTACHDPHQSPYQFQLKEGPASADLCTTCHGDDKMSHKVLHEPLKEGECVACHDPHASPNEFQLLASPDKICFTCHEDKEKTLEADFVHKPVREKCASCHNPHGSENKFQLAASVPDLCFSCHETLHPKVIEMAKGAKQPHAPVEDGECLECHDPHASNFKNLLTEGPQEMELCFKCHDEKAEEINTAAVKHGPIKDGLCTPCHQPHGSDNNKMLRAFFVKKFYNPYDPKMYELCFTCHNENLVTDKRTTTLTKFRNGDRNLHFLHVNRKKGRTCLACHEIHAGQQRRHIRTATPFGSWNIPIKYENTETGGNCAVSCHIRKDYDRENPLELQIDKIEKARK